MNNTVPIRIKGTIRIDVPINRVIHVDPDEVEEFLNYSSAIKDHYLVEAACQNAIEDGNFDLDMNELELWSVKKEKE